VGSFILINRATDSIVNRGVEKTARLVTGKKQFGDVIADVTPIVVDKESRVVVPPDEINKVKNKLYTINAKATLLPDEERKHYSKLISALKLTSESDIDQLVTILVAIDMIKSEVDDSYNPVKVNFGPSVAKEFVPYKLDSGVGITQSTAGYEQHMVVSLADLNESARVLLGDENYQIYARYLATDGARNSIDNSFQQLLSVRNLPYMDKTQAETLISVLYDTRIPDVTGYQKNWISDEGLSAAKSLLSPSQYSVFQEYRNNGIRYDQAVNAIISASQ
jgi:hypothetical protein